MIESNQNAGQITADSLVYQVVERYPQSVAVFVQHRLHCPGCNISPYHTLADCAREYAITLEPLLIDLNQVVELMERIPPGSD